MSEIQYTCGSLVSLGSRNPMFYVGNPLYMYIHVFRMLLNEMRARVGDLNCFSEGNSVFDIIIV